MTRGSVPALPELAALWPAPASVCMAWRCDTASSSYLVVPSSRRPRLLVPAGVTGADRMLFRYAGSTTTRAARMLWRAALAPGLGGRVPVRKFCVRQDPDGIERYLATSLGRDVSLGVLLGPPRPNRKPVLQLFDPAGRTFAFAKVGVTPLAGRLIAAESAALSLLTRRPHPSFAAPAVLHQGTWRGLSILVQEALELGQAGLSPDRPPLAVMAEIAALNGVRVEPLRSSRLLSSPLSWERDWFGMRLSEFERLRRQLVEQPDCVTGSWHGDFGPWNLATDGVETEVWDWERFETDVPVGLDAAHYRGQLGFATGQDAQSAWLQMCSEVAQVLSRGGHRTEAATVVAGAYLVTIGRRYVDDATDGPTPQLRRRLTWLSAVASYASRALAGGTP